MRSHLAVTVWWHEELASEKGLFCMLMFGLIVCFVARKVVKYWMAYSSLVTTSHDNGLARVGLTEQVVQKALSGVVDNLLPANGRSVKFTFVSDRSDRIDLLSSSEIRKVRRCEELYVSSHVMTGQRLMICLDPPSQGGSRSECVSFLLLPSTIIDHGRVVREGLSVLNFLSSQSPEIISRMRCALLIEIQLCRFQNDHGNFITQGRMEYRLLSDLAQTIDDYRSLNAGAYNSPDVVSRSVEK